jgi:nucleotide-binding universal stress UspA family protein
LKELEKRVVEREKEELVHYYEESKKVLFDLGFPEKSLKFEFRYHRSARPKKVSQAILDQVKKGGFGTLVIGRKGATQAREFRMGSVAMRTAAESSNCAVWVV